MINTKEPFYPVDVAEQFGFDRIDTQTERCCFCGKELNKLTANNAMPVKDAHCCMACNLAIVVPARIQRMKEARR